MVCENILTAPPRPNGGRWRFHSFILSFSHKINYVLILMEILSPEGQTNRITGSKVSATLLNGLILPIGEASS